MKSFSHNLLRIALIVSFVFVVFGTVCTVYAQTGDYTPLAPLPGTTKDNCTGTNCKTDFPTYLPNLFNLLIGIAAVMAFAMISWGGFTYMTTDAVLQKDSAREKITNAIWGLLLVIGAYAILYTINPQILTFNLNLDKPDFSKLPVIDATPTTGVTPGTCTNCQPLGTSNIPTNASAQNKGVAPSLAAKLTALNNDLQKIGEGWYVSEAWPPTVNHDDPCHANGTCVDANIKSATAPTIKAFLEAAQKNGLNASYEVKSQALFNALKTAGLPTSATCSGNGTVCINTKATAEHFHIK